MRIEDLDHPKDKPGAAPALINDLRWLGFDWDEEYVQSERKDIYRGALKSLGELAYPCICSRRDVEVAQSAPHSGEQLYYPGTCRGRFKSWAEARAAKGADPCWRFKVEPNTIVEFEDNFVGHFKQDVSSVLGDFPIARDEFGAGYTLACTIDDMLMGVTEVVRGDDLLPATPAQIMLANALCHSMIQRFDDSTISYCHVPLVVGKDGKRLAKRHGDTRIATFRQMGKTPAEIIGFLAHSCGWADKDEPISLAALLPRFDLSTIPRAPFMI